MEDFSAGGWNRVEFSIVDRRSWVDIFPNAKQMKDVGKILDGFILAKLKKIDFMGEMQ